MASVTSSQKSGVRTGTAKNKKKKWTRVNAPWPDQKARQEMSKAEITRDLGKHSKNRDWQAKW
jgi:hypothetical protein